MWTGISLSWCLSISSSQHIVGAQGNTHSTPHEDKDGVAILPKRKSSSEGWGGLLKATLGQLGSKPGLLLPTSSAACTAQNKQRPLQSASPHEVVGSQCPHRPLQLSAQSSAPPLTHPWQLSSAPLPPPLPPRRLTHVDPSNIAGLGRHGSWPPAQPLISMAGSAAIKGIPRLQTGALSLANNSGSEYPTYPRCCPQREDFAA